jgi:hypothetical protein
MKLKDLRLHKWPPVLTLGISLAFFGCATISQVKVTAEVIDPAQVGSRSVMVVPDSYMSDAAEADTVAELVRAQLASLGFNINDTEEKAELIIIATLERSAPGTTPRVPLRMRRPFDISYGAGQTSLVESQQAMRKLGFELRTVPEQEEPRVGLMITAITKDVWLNAPLASESEIPRVWRVVAIAPLTKEDMTTKLVEAAGAKLGEMAATPSTPASPSPTPSPTPKKRPQNDALRRTTPRH